MESLMSFYKTKKFKDLKKKWDEKLKKSGLEDVEKTGKNGQTYLIIWDSFHFHKSYSKTDYDNKRTYYDNAQDFYNKDSFKNNTEKSIWLLHMEGSGVRVIAIKLNLKVWFVHKTVRELVDRMYHG